MPLPELNLDDKTFEELVEEAKKLIPVYSREWTDHNLSDPGITFIELFAWLVEMQLYSLNRITDRHLLKYLEILGNRPLPATPSKADVQFASETIREISARTPLKAVFPSSEVTFETDEEIEVFPLELRKIMTCSKNKFTDVTKFNETEGAYYYPFGDDPKKDDALYLGLYSEQDLRGKKIRLSIYLFEKDLPEVGQHGDEKPEVRPSAEVKWKYWKGDKDWDALEEKTSEETTKTLSQSGHLSFNFPQDIKKGTPPELTNIPEITEGLFWIRCRIEEADYEIPPRIDRILLNIVPATQGQTEEEEMRGSGLPDQVFGTKKTPLVPGSQKITVDNEEWFPVEDFDASKPHDKHYVIYPVKGEILFGNGINGCVPQKDAKIKIIYRSDGGAKANVGARTINWIKDDGLFVSNPFPAYGGKEGEKIEDAFIKFRKDLRVPYTAVTTADFESVTLATPGLRVARAKAIVTSENTVTVVVVPYGPLEKPVPSKGFIRTVCEHLDKHRLITACIEVREPDYVRISVNPEIRIKPGYSPDGIRDRINESLNKFLSPIKRKPDYNEWPFGRTVYRSEVYEVIEGIEGVDCVLKLSLEGEEGKVKYENGNVDIIEPWRLVYPGRHLIEIFEPKTICRE